MKCLLQHVVHFAVRICCGNVKMALCFKHLLQIYLDVLAADATLLAQWNFFHYRPSATKFVKNKSDIYVKKQVTPICPLVTRWTAHDRACKNLCDGLKQIVSALATCISERKKPDAVGIFAKITSSKFLAIILKVLKKPRQKFWPKILTPYFFTATTTYTS